jgi:hypothetical protein
MAKAPKLPPGAPAPVISPPSYGLASRPDVATRLALMRKKNRNLRLPSFK